MDLQRETGLPPVVGIKDRTRAESGSQLLQGDALGKSSSEAKICSATESGSLDPLVLGEHPEPTTGLSEPKDMFSHFPSWFNELSFESHSNLFEMQTPPVVVRFILSDVKVILVASRKTSLIAQCDFILNVTSNIERGFYKKKFDTHKTLVLLKSNVFEVKMTPFSLREMKNFIVLSNHFENLTSSKDRTSIVSVVPETSDESVKSNTAEMLSFLGLIVPRKYYKPMKPIFSRSSIAYPEEMFLNIHFASYILRLQIDFARPRKKSEAGLLPWYKTNYIGHFVRRYSELEKEVTKAIRARSVRLHEKCSHVGMDGHEMKELLLKFELTEDYERLVDYIRLVFVQMNTIMDFLKTHDVHRTRPSDFRFYRVSYDNMKNEIESRVLLKKRNSKKRK